eukprot:CCRYP_015653-RA/>CCRYP_015653-RA protein AED:0.15 eAED:0.15 QI:184/1/1/1/0/0/2/37/121
MLPPLIFQTIQIHHLSTIQSISAAKRAARTAAHSQYISIRNKGHKVVLPPQLTRCQSQTPKYVGWTKYGVVPVERNKQNIECLRYYSNRASLTRCHSSTEPSRQNIPLLVHFVHILFCPIL